jgi:hypothetical protein
MNERFAWLPIWMDKRQPHWPPLPTLKVIYLIGQNLSCHAIQAAKERQWPEEPSQPLLRRLA